MELTTLECEKCGRTCALEVDEFAAEPFGERLIAYRCGDPVRCPYCAPNTYWLLPVAEEGE